MHDRMIYKERIISYYPTYTYMYTTWNEYIIHCNKYFLNINFIGMQILNIDMSWSNIHPQSFTSYQYLGTLFTHFSFRKRSKLTQSWRHGKPVSFRFVSIVKLKGLLLNNYRFLVVFLFLNHVRKKISTKNLTPYCPYCPYWSDLLRHSFSHFLLQKAF